MPAASFKFVLLLKYAKTVVTCMGAGKICPRWGQFYQHRNEEKYFKIQGGKCPPMQPLLTTMVTSPVMQKEKIDI